MAPKRPAPDLFAPAPLPVAPLSHRERLACLRLIRSENVGPVSFRELINCYGGAERALAALPELSRRGGRARAIRVFPADDAERELAAAASAGATPLFTIEPGFPRLLALIDAPPPMVYIKGDVAIFLKPAVAIVGSRQCSAAGAKLARHFASAIGDAGYVIVSGLARGIDRIAHEASLETGTIAALAGGVDSIYPPEHAELYRRIGASGCIISERPPGFVAREKDFPRRNRIIAALAFGIVVIEAAARSGTLVTARCANELGREVFAAPGHPLDPRAEGTNNLLKAGATIATSPDDVLEALRPIVGLDAPRATPYAAPIPSSESEPAIDIGPAQCDAVYAALGPAPCDVDAIVRTTQLPVRDVQIAILDLDLAGRISRPGPGLVARRDVDG